MRFRLGLGATKGKSEQCVIKDVVAGSNGEAAGFKVTQPPYLFEMNIYVFIPACCHPQISLNRLVNSERRYHSQDERLRGSDLRRLYELHANAAQGPCDTNLGHA